MAMLTDGKLAEGFGPIFGTGVASGAYKMDLGKAQPVLSVSSWSFNMGKSRGEQILKVYGSDSVEDPGWDLKSLTELGAIDTAGGAKDKFTAASLKTPSGKPLGSFRWIVWAVSPVSSAGGGENTAFQELAVEVQKMDQPKANQTSNRRPEKKVGSIEANADATAEANAFPGKKTDFHGFDCYQFKTETGVAIKVVAPKEAAPGKPWLWRSLFWEGLPKIWTADLKLVEEGYHVVLVHGDVSGHPSGNANI